MKLKEKKKEGRIGIDFGSEYIAAQNGPYPLNLYVSKMGPNSDIINGLLSIYILYRASCSVWSLNNQVRRPYEISNSPLLLQHDRIYMQYHFLIFLFFIFKLMLIIAYMISRLLNSYAARGHDSHANLNLPLFLSVVHSHNIYITHWNGNTEGIMIRWYT